MPRPARTPTHIATLFFPPVGPGSHQPCSFSGRYHSRDAKDPAQSPATTTGPASTGSPSAVMERPVVKPLRGATSRFRPILVPPSVRRLSVLSARRPHDDRAFPRMPAGTRCPVSTQQGVCRWRCRRRKRACVPAWVGEMPRSRCKMGGIGRSRHRPVIPLSTHTRHDFGSNKSNEARGGDAARGIPRSNKFDSPLPPRRRSVISP